MKKLFLKDALFIGFLLAGFLYLSVWPARTGQADTSGNAESSSTTKTVTIPNSGNTDLETRNITSNNLEITILENVLLNSTEIESNIEDSIDAKSQPYPNPQNTTSKRMLPVTLPCTVDIDVMTLDFIF
ncbi:MAG: hypothetical protein ACUZ8E_03605 [Candidatus Anammoxibacter sp.]